MLMKKGFAKYKGVSFTSAIFSLLYFGLSGGSATITGCSEASSPNRLKICRHIPSICDHSVTAPRDIGCVRMRCPVWEVSSSPANIASFLIHNVVG